MFYLYSFIYSKVVLNLSLLLLLNINTILKKGESHIGACPLCFLYSQSQCGQQLFGFPHSSKYLLTDVNVWHCIVYWYGDDITAADRMCAVARYNDISSKVDHGDIFIRAAAGQMCPKQDFIVVPPSSNIMEVKKKTKIGVKIEL